MNYVYDILLNFQALAYEFYDWNVNDHIMHIRKIPIFRVTSQVLNKMISTNFSVTPEFLKKISNRTEVFTNKNVKIMKFTCLFSDAKDVIAVSFSNNGLKEKSSKLLLDEREDILQICENIELFNIEIKEGKKIIKEKFKTRQEQEIYNYIQKEMKKNNYDRLKYTYLECFNQEEIEYDKIVEKIKKVLNNNWDDYYMQVYNILKLSSIKKSRNY